MNNQEGEEEDFSSSVAWDTPAEAPQAQEQASSSSDPYSAYSSTPAAPSTTTTTTGTTQEALSSERIHSVRVLDGKTELEGTSDMFVSYLVTATTDLTTFNSKTPSSRRRFQDFVFLRQSLTKDFPACVVPPLPDKHRMEYVVGDRFSADFIEKRRIDLERFLQRLSKHPKLSRTGLFQNFLESTEWNVYKHKYQAQSSSSSHHLSSTTSNSSFDDTSTLNASTSSSPPPSNGLLDNISDTLLNAFTKLKKPDPRFTQIRSQLDSFEEGLSSIERLGSRSKTRLGDLSNDYEDFAVSIQGLGYLESGITEPLMRFERSLIDFSSSLKSSSTTSSSDFIEHLHSLLGYSHSFKGVLKLRDQKQLDFEELSTYLSNVVTERDRLAGGYGYGMGLTSYFKEKIEGLKQVGSGQDTDMSKAARLTRLDAKIKELQEAVLASQQTSTAFNDCVLEEYEVFKRIKRWEMKKLLGEYAKGQIEFQKKVLESWDKTIPFIKRIHVEP
ncbi:uncharacterized protein JCM6883_005122 [Sporobolomyces salmoneus]|uniref:uncharacterized protein n=1 Tax=Sporobolomyces salmoneus TaxID=183962 RepID=UPI0031805B9F